MAQAAPHSVALRRDDALPLPGASFWRSAGWLSLLAILAGLLCLIYLVATSSVLSAGYDIQRAERERSEWQAKNEQLQLELAKVRSLAWIEAQSMTRLGMVRPDDVLYVHLDQPSLAAHRRPVAAAQRLEDTPRLASASPSGSEPGRGSR